MHQIYHILIYYLLTYLLNYYSINHIGSIDIDNSSIKMVVRERRLLLIELFFIVSEILELPRSIIHVTVSILDRYVQLIYLFTHSTKNSYLLLAHLFAHHRFVHIRSYNYIDNKSSVPYYFWYLSSYVALCSLIKWKPTKITRQQRLFACGYCCCSTSKDTVAWNLST